ncbi:hypothetical protein [Microbaculum sp. FT89]|uniref:hypothetical protein n=1 Tax=Microbaculum sp. FT89 TaxID=3447298 RepID=UPI003F52EC9F
MQNRTPDDNETPPGSALIDEVYRILSGIEEDIQQLELHAPREKVDIFIAPNLIDAYELLDEFEFENRFGLSTNDLSKYQRMQGEVSRDVLLQFAHRAISLLREFEGTIVRETSIQYPESANEQNLEPEKSPAPPYVDILPVAWVSINRRSNAQLIGKISELLDEAITLAKSTNLPPEQRALSDIERAQLITLLDTALNLLKSPLVEKGLLERLKSAAGKGAEAVVSKKTELALGYGLGRIVELLGDFLMSLGD